MNINNFKGSFESLARPTLFRVYGLGAGRDLEFMCKAAQLPATNMGIIEVPYMGRKVKIAGDRTYEDWTITVMNKTDFAIRNHFEDWLSRINDPVLNVGTSVPSAYKEDGFVDQLDSNGNVLVTYQMVGMFPTNVAPIELSWETNDAVEEFTVTFAMDYHVRN
jgi:hypothetical protein